MKGRKRGDVVASRRFLPIVKKKLGHPFARLLALNCLTMPMGAGPCLPLPQSDFVHVSRTTLVNLCRVTGLNPKQGTSGSI